MDSTPPLQYWSMSMDQNNHGLDHLLSLAILGVLGASMFSMTYADARFSFRILILSTASSYCSSESQ